MTYAQNGFTSGTTVLSVNADAQDKMTTPVKLGIMYLPGGGGLATSWQVDPVIAKAWQYCAEWGFRVTSLEDDWLWGNDEVLGRIDTLYSYAQTNFAYQSTKVHLWGVSMGTVCILNWAKANPSKVASIACILPVPDIQDIYDNNRTDALGLPHATFGPQIAYGGPSPGTLGNAGVRPPDDHTPSRNPASYTGYPIKFWYGETDPIATSAAAIAFASAVNALGGDVRTQSLGAGGHTIPTNWDPNDFQNFFNGSTNGKVHLSLVAPDIPQVPTYLSTAGRGQ